MFLARKFLQSQFKLTLSVLYRTKKPQCIRCYTTKLKHTEENNNKPIEYTTSAASRWQAKSSRIGTDSNRLWYEPYIILASIAVFMIYFCILREENDIDKEFNQTLYKRVRGLEEQQLLILLEYNRKHGLEIKEIEDRLSELSKNNDK